MPDFKAARKNMVDCQIHTAGIIYPGIMEAFGAVPRETFVPPALKKVAYADEDLHFGKGRYLPEPVTHARMLQALAPVSSDIVLDVGGGTGYTAAIMARLGGGIVALEEEAATLDQAIVAWRSVGAPNIVPVKGKLVNGCPEHGPFNIIFINGAVAEIPYNFLQQLAPGGSLIAIVKKPGAVMGQVTLVKNSVGDKFSSRVLFEAGGHYLPGFEPQPAFSFNGQT